MGMKQNEVAGLSYEKYAARECQHCKLLGRLMLTFKATCEEVEEKEAEAGGEVNANLLLDGVAHAAGTMFASVIASVEEAGGGGGSVDFRSTLASCLDRARKTAEGSYAEHGAQRH